MTVGAALEKITPHALATLAAVVMSEVLLTALSKFGPVQGALTAFALPPLLAAVTIPGKKRVLLWLTILALPILLTAVPPRRLGLTLGDVLIFTLVLTVVIEKVTAADRSWRWEKTIFTWPLLGLLLVAIVSAVASEDPPLAISDILENVRYALFYLIFLALVRSKDDLKLACKLILVGFVPMLLLGFAQYYLGIGLDIFAPALGNTNFAGGGIQTIRIFGPFSESLAFAQYMLVPLFFLAGIAFHSRRPMVAVPLAVWFGVGCFALLLTLSRGSWAGFLVAFATLVWLRVPVRSIAYLALAAAIVGIAIAGYWDVVEPALPASAVARMRDLGHDYAVGRGITWTATATRILADYPLLGVGGRNLFHVLPRYEPDILWDPVWVSSIGGQSPLAGLTGFTWHMHVDSFYITLLAEFGILGMIPLAILFFRLIAQAFANYRAAAPDLKPYALGVLGASVAMTVSLISAHTYADIPLALLLWLLFAMTVVLRRLNGAHAAS